MFSKTIKFKDFSGEEQIQEFYFHIGKAELLELGIANIQQRLKRMMNTNDSASMLQQWKELIHMAAGMRSDDGRRFIKDDAAKSALFDSNAYDELLFELCTDAESSVEFVRNLFPESLQEEMKKYEKKAEATSTVTVEGAGVVKKEFAIDDRPQWLKEGRMPTPNEFREATAEQKQLAFSMKLNTSTTPDDAA